MKSFLLSFAVFSTLQTQLSHSIHAADCTNFGIKYLSLRLRGGENAGHLIDGHISDNFTFLAAHEREHCCRDNPKPSALESIAEADDTWSSEDLRLRREQIASQPWFGADGGDQADIITQDIATEGALQSLIESGLVDGNARIKNDTTISGTNRIIQVAARNEIVDYDSFDSNSDEMEYVSEDVCEEMTKDAIREHSSNRDLIVEESEKENAITFDHLVQVPDRSADFDLGEENMEMVRILSNYTVQVVDHSVVRHRLDFLILNTVTDLTSAIDRESIVVPSLPVSIVSFLSAMAHRFVEVHDAKGKRVGRALIGELQGACSSIEISLRRLGRVSRGQGMWAMREMMRVAEVGLEVGLDADVVVRRLAQRARQVMARRRVSVREARDVEEALELLRDAGQVDSNAGPELALSRI